MCEWLILLFLMLIVMVVDFSLQERRKPNERNSCLMTSSQIGNFILSFNPTSSQSTSLLFFNFSSFDSLSSPQKQEEMIWILNWNCILFDVWTDTVTKIWSFTIKFRMSIKNWTLSTQLQRIRRKSKVSIRHFLRCDLLIQPFLCQSITFVEFRYSPEVVWTFHSGWCTTTSGSEWSFSGQNLYVFFTSLPYDFDFALRSSIQWIIIWCLWMVAKMTKPNDIPTKDYFEPAVCEVKFNLVASFRSFLESRKWDFWNWFDILACFFTVGNILRELSNDVEIVCGDAQQFM